VPETLTSDTRSGAQLFEGSSKIFRERFNRASFAFSHRLADHPLFQLPALIELAKSMPTGDLYYDAGDIRIDQRWDRTPPCQMSFEELIDRIENSGAWIIIRRARRNPEYAELLDQGLAELQDLTGGALPVKMMKRDAMVFITSPKRVTPYHIDRECNFLLQIQGEKVIHIFDRYDRDVLPEEELERFWTLDNNAAVYKEQYQDRARSYDLKPGMSVHIPVNAPHWVKNSGEISVTLSLNFQFGDANLADIYRVNHYIRKTGRVPLPPGRSRLLDAVKGAALGPLLKVGRKLELGKLMRRIRGRRP
jgi:hypothetical protein